MTIKRYVDPAHPHADCVRINAFGEIAIPGDGSRRQLLDFAALVALNAVDAQTRDRFLRAVAAAYVQEYGLKETSAEL